EAYLGNIYKGRVVNIEPSIGAAFVSFGGTTNGFLHASDVLPDYAREDFSITDVLEGRARATGDDGPDVVRAVLEDADDEEDEAAGDEEKAADADASAEDEDDEEDDAVDRDEEHVVGGGADEDDDDLHGGAHAHDDEVAEATGDDELAEADGEAVDAAAAGAAEAPEPEGHGDAEPAAAEGAAGEGAPATATVVADARTRGRQGRKAAEKRARRPRLPIDKLLRRGQEVIVQITKEGIGNKGPTLTTYISLPGRCLVLMPSLPKCGVSRKIEGQKERRRLKRIVRELDTIGNGGVGFIVRTAGTGKTKEDLQRDRDYLQRIWEFVGQRARVTRAPALLYQESDLVLK